jgi:O-antigen/teichoic acid export membrane protein
MLILRSGAIFDQDMETHDFARKAVRGGSVALTSQGALFALQFAGTVILARLLTPGDFGLVSMATAVILFAQVLRDAGLYTATVQAENVSRQKISALFWVNVLVSAVLGGVLLGLAPVVAWFFRQPQLAGVTAALSGSFLLGGLATQHQALLNRMMMFRSLAIIQVGSQVAYLTAATAIALAGWGYWALVWATVSSAVLGLFLTLLLCRWRPGRPQLAIGMGTMLRFGSHVLGFNVVSYFARNADNILIGRFLGAGALGLYSRAYNLFMMPYLNIANPILQVGLPALGRLVEWPERFAKYYRKLLGIVALLTVPVAALCIIEAEFLIRLLLGPQWMGAVPVLRLLAVTGLIQPSVATTGLVQLGLGQSRRYLHWGVVNAVCLVSSIVIGLPFGIVGVASAYAVANYLLLVPTVRFCLHRSPVHTGAVYWEIGAAALMCLVASAAALVTEAAMPSGTTIRHIAAICVFVLVYSLASLSRRSVRETLRVVRQGVSADTRE